METTLDTIELEYEEMLAAERQAASEYEYHDFILLQTEYEKVINKIRSHSLINL